VQKRRYRAAARELRSQDIGACAENPNGYFPGKKAAIPTADKPDF
jgi:hypothetical protein